MNIAALSARVHSHGGGFRASDFDPARLEPGQLIVSPVRPPELSLGGIEIPDAARNIRGQFAIMHRVEVVAAKQPEGIMQVQVGDIVKVRNAFLDPLDPTGELCSVPTKHVLAVLVPAQTEFAPSKPRLAFVTPIVRAATDLNLDDDTVLDAEFVPGAA